MRHDETRDNTTDIENQIREADAHADTRETPTKLVNDADGHELGIYRPGTWRGRMLRQAEAMFGKSDAKIAREHDEIVAKARQESEERNGYDPEDPEHDPIGDAETEYDIEYDDEPEDDGQPSEYEEWQDYMGGDEYYDHSENECW